MLVSHEKENGVIYMYCVSLRQLIEQTTNKHISSPEKIYNQIYLGKSFYIGFRQWEYVQQHSNITKTIIKNLWL